MPGKDERESNSPSFFNTSEITVVVDYLKKLLLAQGKKGIAKISPKDIGIITPYRKQVGTRRTTLYLLPSRVIDFQGDSTKYRCVQGQTGTYGDYS